MFDSKGSDEGAEMTTTTTTATKAAKQRRPRLDARLEAFVIAYRAYQHAAAQPLVVPEELLEAGYMPLAMAATLLKTPAAKLAKLERSDTAWIPVLSGKRVPVSEVCRAFRRLQKKIPAQMAKAAADVLNDRSEPLWSGHAGVATGPIFWNASDRGFFDLSHDDDDNDGIHGIEGHGLENVAAILELPKAEVKRLLEDRTIFAYRPRRGGWLVTQAEVDAHKRRLERERATQPKAA